MSCYLVISAKIKDPVAFKQYATKTAEFVAECGGTYIVVGGAPVCLEDSINAGGFDPATKLVISEWDSAEHARSFWDSDMYQKNLKPLRAGTGDFSVLLVEGVPLSK